MTKQQRPLSFFIALRSLTLSLIFVGCCLSSRKVSVSAFLTTSSSSYQRHCCKTVSHNDNAPRYNRQRVAVRYGDMGASGKRAAEIRRKIAQLKKEGRLKKQNEYGEIENDDDDDEVPTSDLKEVYGDRVRQKLGDKKSKLLGFVGSDKDAQAEEDDDDEESDPAVRMGQLGGLSRDLEDDKQSAPSTKSSSGVPIIDPSLFEDDNDENDSINKDLDEEELVDMVALKMREKRDREQREKELRIREEAREKLAAIEKQRKEEAAASPGAPEKTTSGVGGSWSKNETSEVDMYQPKSGSWGAFPRPKDISKAFGGGRRVGAGYTKESTDDDTRERLKRYREKAGIEVQSEKDHAEEIDEALRIGGLAMQRGMYSTAVSALEKVTKWCSTNSKVGGKVFLELAMAYEAVGRTQEAVTVYTTLSNCRIEEIKFNAKRLLYGIEAMQFMRNEMKDSNFSRKKAKNTFIDTTGLKYMAENFDDKYQTAYIDLEGSFYKRLTESVVRSAREARQILLRATDAGEVDRMRIVQALRSLSRNFEDALEKEIELKRTKEPVAVMDGRPIMPRRVEEEESYSSGIPDTFVLSDPDQMEQNLGGEWRLQLLADKRGDGVKFFNNTISRQILDMEKGSFEAQIPAGFGNVQLSGTIEFNPKKRVLRRQGVETAGGGVFAGLVNPQNGPSGAVRAPQQVMMVDSTLLATRGVPNKISRASKDDEKEYFAVWRRLD